MTRNESYRKLFEDLSQSAVDEATAYAMWAVHCAQDGSDLIGVALTPHQTSLLLLAAMGIANDLEEDSVEEVGYIDIDAVIREILLAAKRGKLALSDLPESGDPADLPDGIVDLIDEGIGRLAYLNCK